MREEKLKEPVLGGPSLHSGVSQEGPAEMGEKASVCLCVCGGCPCPGLQGPPEKPGLAMTPLLLWMENVLVNHVRKQKLEHLHSSESHPTSKPERRLDNLAKSPHLFRPQFSHLKHEGIK